MASPAGTPHDRPLPWRIGDLMAAYVAACAGGVLIVTGWWGLSSKAFASQQVGWLSLGILGLVVAGIVEVTWLMVGRRAVGERRRRLNARMSSLLPDVQRRPASGPGPSALVAMRSMRHFHRPDCPLATAKPVRAASRSAHGKAGRKPCGVCDP
jgi:hypothetical protein